MNWVFVFQWKGFGLVFLLCFLPQLRVRLLVKPELSQYKRMSTLLFSISSTLRHWQWSVGGRCLNELWFFREDQVNFRGFMRTLAHFRPIEDNEKNKNAAATEPLNSRTNKLLCECLLELLTSYSHIQRISQHWTTPLIFGCFFFSFSQLHSVCMTWTEMTKSPGMSCCRWVSHWVTNTPWTL